MRAVHGFLKKGMPIWIATQKIPIAGLPSPTMIRWFSIRVAIPARQRCNNCFDSAY